MMFNGNAVKRGLVACLAVLFASTPASLANTGNGGQGQAAAEKPEITLHGTAYNGWQLSTSGRVTVDGRFAQPYDRIENGSHIVVDPASTAKAEIKGFGRVSLAPRSEIVLDVVDDTLVARMLRGNMRVEVAARYGAYIETPDSLVVSHPGTFASFRVKADPLGSSLTRDLGDVEISTIVRDDDDWDIDFSDDDDDEHVKARGDETIKIKLKRDGDRVSNQAVNFAITAALNGATGSFEDGAQRVTVMTDSEGEAEVEFFAGAGEGQVDVEVQIPGTDAHETFRLFIDAKEKTFWNKYTTALYIAMGAGAVAGAVIAIENTRGDDRPQTPRGPIVTVP